MSNPPQFREFRLEEGGKGIVHLVFDMPNRSMNVFSNDAIREIGQFARWLRTADVTGVIVRSAKPAFCAGADLGELGVAYDAIVRAPPDTRWHVAYDHFFPLSKALRALETAGKPVAAAVNGLALGGGCELALACHFRILADTPKAALGLPESLVGLLPGAGGTQRLPRLVGVEAALPVLLEGRRFDARQALQVGAAHEVVAEGQEIAAAEQWINAHADAMQPWDRLGWKDMDARDVTRIIASIREKVVAETFGHYPAPLAILDCVERGLPVPLDRAVEIEMEIFAHLIKRLEPRNMIQTLFLAKLDFDKRAKAGELPAALEEVKSAILGAVRYEIDRAKAEGRSADMLDAALRESGFSKAARLLNGAVPLRPVVADGVSAARENVGFWFEHPLGDANRRLAARFIVAGAAAVSGRVAHIDEADQKLLDHAIVSTLGFPSYLGGSFALIRYLGSDGARRILG
jgi:3-hydroxyacyl-CoA dehydrogenase / enoyl-CoA hydratase / 3-hydroxybutyryl-CoA epimerase